MSCAIKAEGLAKKYIISHQAREEYGTLRDSLARGVSRLAARIRSGGGAGEEKEEFWALKDVSFEIKHGDKTGVIGRNGAGKSTLLKIISRITEPTAGRAVINGRVASLLEVGTGFHPELTGRENIYLNGSILGMTRAEIKRKFDEIVAFSGVERFLDTPVKRYSSGMYVRLAFAVAAHLEPDILLVDEVLAVGDYEFQKKCLGKMEDVSREGRTVLFVSHNMSAITRLCPRALLLDAGRVVMEGVSTEVTAWYLSSGGGGGVKVFNADDGAKSGGGPRLVSISAVGGGGEPVSVVSVNDGFDIELRYRVENAGMPFRCAVMLYTQGVCAFTSIEPRETVKEKAGEYVSKVRVPAHFLAEGEYMVWVSIFTTKGIKAHYVQLRDAITFQVFDPMDGASARGDYAQNLAGVVRPILEWKTESEG